MGAAKLQLNKDLISDEEIASIAQNLHDELSGRKASEEWQRSRASIGSKWYYGRDGHLVIVRNSEERNPALTYTTNWRRLSGITRDDGSLLESDQIEGMDGGYWTPQWAAWDSVEHSVFPSLLWSSV